MKGFHLMFVYGTLKAGFPLHDWLTGEGEGIDRTSTPLPENWFVKGFYLYDLGPYPAALRCDGAHCVLGEVWEVPVERFMPLVGMEKNAGFDVKEVSAISESGKEVKAAMCFLPMKNRHFGPTPDKPIRVHEWVKPGNVSIRQETPYAYHRE